MSWTEEESYMGDPTSTYIFSIDPGIVNIGVALYDYKTGEVLFADKVQLAPSMKAMGPDSEIVTRVFKLFFDDRHSPYKKMINSAKVVLVENQMKAKMKIIQHVIGAFCFAGNQDHRMVAPQSVKAHFNTGAYARKKNGIVLKGNKNNHAANKKMGIAKATELHPTLFSQCSPSKRDDIADALLQAIYWGDTLSGTKKRKVTSSPVVKRKKRSKKRSKKK
jgi:hypothetical protein